MSSRRIPYSIVDVFTTQRFCGNPLAVIRDATGMSDKEMRSVAHEFGLSETTFILPPENPSNTATVRIFTPHMEIPFAGHPNVGTAYVIANDKTAATSVSGDTMVFEESGGNVSVSLLYVGGKVCGARITAPQKLYIQRQSSPAAMAKCLGLPVDQIVTQRFSPCVASAGLPFLFVHLQDLQSLARIDTSASEMSDAEAAGLYTADEFSICAFVLLSVSSSEIHARVRVLNPLSSPPEDPATGSAAGALAALLSDQQGTAELLVNISQGVEMGKPGEITVVMDPDDPRPRIGGYCVSAARGEFYL